MLKKKLDKALKRNLENQSIKVENKTQPKENLQDPSELAEELT